MKSTFRFKTKPMWKPGDAVVLWSDSSQPRCRKEYGRVIETMWDAKYGWWDVWVAFFGFRWPTQKMLHEEKPYVLHYLETSLKPYTPKGKRWRENASTRSSTRTGRMK